MSRKSESEKAIKLKEVRKAKKLWKAQRGKENGSRIRIAVTRTYLTKPHFEV